jgi:hypothetical protein
MQEAEAANKFGDALQAVEDAWVQAANLKLFDDAVADAINAGSHANKAALVHKYAARVKGRSNAFARAVAREVLGRDVYFDWEAPRTREGFYRYKGGCGCAVTRAIAYAPYADCIWMESKLPDFAQAKEFADGVHAVWPQQKYVPLARIGKERGALTRPGSRTTCRRRSIGRRRCRGRSRRRTSTGSRSWGTAGSSSRWRGYTRRR